MRMLSGTTARLFSRTINGRGTTIAPTITREIAALIGISTATTTIAALNEAALPTTTTAATDIPKAKLRNNMDNVK
jgi:hypothetical protein